MTAIVDLSDTFLFLFYFFLTLIIKRVVLAPLIFITTLIIDLDPTVQISLILYLFDYIYGMGHGGLK